MATIGNISLMLKVNAAGFVAGMTKASKTVADFSKSALNLTGVVSGVGAVLGGLSIGAIAVYAKKALEGAAATAKLARSVNSSVSGLAALQYQIKSLGGDQAAAAKGLAILNEKLGDIGPGGEQAQQMIGRLGLSFATLQKMPTDRAFALIAEKIGSIQEPARRAAAAAAIFGDEAEHLLPALTQGKAGLTAAQQAAQKLGLAFTDLDASKVEDANTKLGLMGEVLHGVATQFAVNLAPWILKTADELSKLGVTGASVGKAMAEAFRLAAKAIAYTLEYTKKAGILLVVGLQGSLMMFIGVVNGQLAKLFSLAAKLPDSLGGNMFRGFAEDAQRNFEAAKESLHQLKKEATEQFNASNYGEQVDAFFDRITQGAEQGAKAMQSLDTKLAKGALPIANRFKKLFGSEANAVIQETQTPLEKFHQKLGQIDAMVKSGAITWDQYARATGKAVEELDRAHGLSEAKLAGGLKRESAEALSAINQQDAMLNQRLRESPEARLERLQQQSVAIESQQLEYLKRVAAAVQQAPQFQEMPP